MSSSSKSANNVVVKKPLSPSEFNPNDVIYGKIMKNVEFNTKSLTTLIRGKTSATDKILVVARGCIIKSFKELTTDEAHVQSNKPPVKKYQIFLSINDESFIKMVQEYENALLDAALKHTQEWFETDFDMSDITGLSKSILSKHDKYGYGMGGILAYNFTCKSKTPDITDVSDLTVALAKGTKVDVCFNFNKVKFTKSNEFRPGAEVSQINIIEASSGENFVSNAITPEEYVPKKISLGQLETKTINEKDKLSGKYCKLLYNNETFRFVVTNMSGRIFKNVDKKTQVVSYSLSIRVTDKAFRTMLENVNKEIFDILLEKSETIYGGKKTERLLKSKYKSILSYNKTDEEKISKNQKPDYDPSVWVKIFYNEKEGFANKIVNNSTQKAITNLDEYTGKDITIASIEVYSRHVWIGDLTTVNFTLNKCSLSTENVEYAMDDVDDVDTEESNVVANSDDEDSTVQKKEDDDEEESVHEPTPEPEPERVPTPPPASAPAKRSTAKSRK